MKVPDLFVGKRLFVGCGIPLSLGVGPTEIRGSAYIEGPLLLGNPLSYPAVAEANLMVARCANIEAIPPPPSIFKVSTRGLEPTPIDVMLGDPTGHVGITVNSTIISIFNDTNISIISPYTTGVGVLNWVGAKTFAGVVAEAGAEARTGAEAVGGETCDSGAKVINGPLNVAGPITAPIYYGDISRCTGKKDFDISHPTKNGWRLRHVCIEGPTADVYIRGKLIDSNVIELPDYWRNLVDLESITVTLTPYGNYQELFVDKIEWGSRVIVKNNSGSSVKCHYMICGERIDVEKNIPEYEGSYEDYPGDNSQYLNPIRFITVEK